MSSGGDKLLGLRTLKWGNCTVGVFWQARVLVGVMWCVCLSVSDDGPCCTQTSVSTRRPSAVPLIEHLRRLKHSSTSTSPLLAATLSTSSSALEPFHTSHDVGLKDLLLGADDGVKSALFSRPSASSHRHTRPAVILKQLLEDRSDATSRLHDGSVMLDCECDATDTVTPTNEPQPPFVQLITSVDSMLSSPIESVKFSIAHSALLSSVPVTSSASVVTSSQRPTTLTSSGGLQLKVMPPRISPSRNVLLRVCITQLFTAHFHRCLEPHQVLLIEFCRGGPAPDRLSAALVSRKFAVARACVRGPRQQADVSAAG